MFERCTLILVAVFLLSPATLRADEIKLKNGEVITDCKVKSTRKGKVTIQLLDGSRKILKESDIAEIIEKPTIADDIEARLAKLGKKDVDGMMGLAREANEKGAVAILKTICRKVLRADKKNVEAHELMGDELCADGKWRGGRSLEKYKASAREAELKAKGWKKIKGEWHDPVTAANLQAGLVEHEGAWYTPDHVANLKAGKIWVEGEWYAAGDRAKLDQGMLKYKGEWLKISDINQKIKANNEVWNIESAHFIVNGRQAHDTLKRLSDFCENLWEPMARTFGGAPNCVKTEDKIRIIVAPNNQTYREMHSAHPGDDRVANYSSALGAYYSPKSGVILTYYYNADYLIQWVQHVVPHAFMSRVFGYENCASPLYESFAGYFQGFYEGKYVAYNEMWFNGMKGWNQPNPIDAFENFDIMVPENNPTKNETRFNRLSLSMHFLQEKHPEVIQSFVGMLRAKKASKKATMALLRKTFDEKELTEFALFVQLFVSSYVRPM